MTPTKCSKIAMQEQENPIYDLEHENNEARHSKQASSNHSGLISIDMLFNIVMLSHEIYKSHH